MGETLCQSKCGRVEGQSLSVTVFLVRAEECFNAVVLQVRAAEPWNASVRRHQGAMNCRVSEHQVTLTSVLLPEALNIADKQIASSDVIGKVRERLSKFNFLTERGVSFYVTVIRI